MELVGTAGLLRAALCTCALGRKFLDFFQLSLSVFCKQRLSWQEWWVGFVQSFFWEFGVFVTAAQQVEDHVLE